MISRSPAPIVVFAARRCVRRHTSSELSVHGVLMPTNQFGRSRPMTFPVTRSDDTNANSPRSSLRRMNSIPPSPPLCQADQIRDDLLNHCRIERVADVLPVTLGQNEVRVA